MTSREAYGGAVCALRCAREESDPAERERWLTKARDWRHLARLIRRREAREKRWQTGMAA